MILLVSNINYEEEEEEIIRTSKYYLKKVEVIQVLGAVIKYF